MDNSNVHRNYLKQLKLTYNDFLRELFQFGL